MFGLLALLFLVVPIAELFVIVQTAQGIGIPETIVVLIAVSVLGAWLVKREGLGIVTRVQRELAGGQVPTNAVVDGFLVLFAGALLMTPGFLTDIGGILLLLPPVRALVRPVLIRRFRARATRVVAGGPAGARIFLWDSTGVRRSPDVTDVASWERDPRAPNGNAGGTDRELER